MWEYVILLFTVVAVVYSEVHCIEILAARKKKKCFHPLCICHTNNRVAWQEQTNGKLLFFPGILNSFSFWCVLFRIECQKCWKISSESVEAINWVKVRVIFIRWINAVWLGMKNRWLIQSVYIWRCDYYVWRRRRT